MNAKTPENDLLKSRITLSSLSKQQAPPPSKSPDQQPSVRSDIDLKLEAILTRLAEVELGQEMLRSQHCRQVDDRAVHPNSITPEQIEEIVAPWRERVEHLEIEKGVLLDQVQEARVRAENAVLDARVEVVNPTHPKVVALTNSIRTEALMKERELHGQIESLQNLISQLEAQLTLANSNSPSLDKSIHEEIAESFAREVEELRSELQDLKSTNAELQQRNVELTKRIKNGSNTSEEDKPISTDAMSWEELKQAWLAQIESENAGEDEPRILEIQEVIQASNSEIDRRDLEIAELRHLLSEQSFATEGIAVGAAAIASQLDMDDLIREERERLAAMQEALEQKLRQTEIEMSLERAKLARERLQLQETIQQIEESQFHLQYGHTSSSQAETVNDMKPRGRWLQRLGLHNT